MRKAITFINKPLIIGIATLITIASIFKFPEQKRPFFTAKSSTININKINQNFSNKIIELNHLYNCEKIDELDNCRKRNLPSITTTRLMLWNGGRKTIDKTDIEDNPLKIVSKSGTEILDIVLLNTSNSESNVILNKKTKNIYFSFLESGNGFVMDIIHTGASENDITIEGYIKNSRFEDNFRYIARSDLYSIGDYISIAFIYICSIALSFSFLVWKNRGITEYLRERQINSILFYILFQTVVMLISFVLPIFVALAVRYKNTPYLLRVPDSSYEVFNAE